MKNPQIVALCGAVLAVGAAAEPAQSRVDHYGGSFLLAAATLSVQEDVAVRDIGVMNPSSRIDIEETVAVSDEISFRPSLRIDIEESIGVTDDVSLAPELQIVVNEVVTVSASASQTRTSTEHNHEYVRVLLLAGPEGGDTIWDLAVDDEGWLYVAGDYTALHFDGDGIPELESMGGHDPLIIKTRMAGDGWVKSLHSTSIYNTGVAVSPDRTGGAYLAGQYEEVLMLEGGIQLAGRGGKDGYIARYNAGGMPVWAKALGGAGADSVDDLASDSSGNVYFIGGTTGAMDISDDGVIDTRVGSRGFGAVVGSLSRSGDWRWTRALSSPVQAVANAIAVSDDGGVYVSGAFQSGRLQFEGAAPQDLVAAGTHMSGFLARIDDGEWRWGRQFKGAAHTTISAVTTATNDDVIVAGRVDATTSFDGGNNQSVQLDVAERTPFLARYSSGGDLLWVRPYFAREIESIAANDLHIVVSGYYRGGPLDIDGDSIPEAGEGGDNKNDGFVAILDSNGTLQKAFAVVGRDGDQVRAVGLSPDGRTMWAWGFFRDDADFDGDGEPEGVADDSAAGEIFGAQYRIDR